ncbi:MAG: M28 family metallopeptidase [Gammaproteobacteria bacterium]|nr:M28 family metallopeptidase [Gammaproteobacteria bacterium]MDH4315305.1 M28 family metallopeptidase [Gammaproteobacteria bacterium]MDH5213420.1 M28 family metallopeptidase [Gammaproteobacteria bacterium]
MKRPAIYSCLVCFAVACSPPEQVAENGHAVALGSITGAEIRAHMEVLAADEMQGREAGTDGYKKAADYVAGQYRAIGLLPIGDDHSYFQQIEFFETRLEPESARLVLHANDGDTELVFRDDFIRDGGYGEASEEITAPLVFVGHGIVAPEYAHDDFAGVDVAGKIIVTLSGAPPLFATDQRAFYSSGLGKDELAVALGAVGVITVRTPVDQARRPWERYLPGIGTPGMRWLDADGKPFAGFPELTGSATLSESGAAKLFSAAGHDLQAIFDKHAEGATGSFDLGLSATLARKSKQRSAKSSNVVGLLGGSDPSLAKEYIVYTAHLDHIGIRPGEGGDDIHNGAYDNAAGIAAILEIAAGMAVLDTAPRRSMIFAAVTGEEKGLQGSSYFAKNPPVPARGIVANINIDMPYLGFPVADIEAFGAEHSTLLAAVTRAAAQTGMALTADPMPEEVRFVRSDQFSFVKEGVPAVAFKAGSKSFDPAVDGAAMLQDFLKNHYHRASDDLSLPFSAEGAEKFVQTALLLGLEIAEQNERPKWNRGDFFGDKFAQ